MDSGFEVTSFNALVWNDPTGPDEGVVELDTVVYEAPFSQLISENNLAPQAVSAAAIAQQANEVPPATVPKFAVLDLVRDRWLTKSEEPAIYVYRQGSTNTSGMKFQAGAAICLVRRPADSLKVQADDTQTIADEASAKSNKAASIALEPIAIPVDLPGFDSLLIPAGLPIARATTGRHESTTHHRIWPITQSGFIDAICSAGKKAIQSIDNDPNHDHALPKGDFLAVLHPTNETIRPIAVGMVLAEV